MRVLDAGAGRFAVVLEHHDVPEPRVPFQIEYEVAQGPEQVFDALFRQIGEREAVVRRLDDHFMGANTRHAIVHAFALTVQLPFHSQCGKFVGYYAQRPAAFIDAAAGPVCQHLRWCLGFVSRTKRAEAAWAGNDGLPVEIARATAAVGGDDYQALGYRVRA